MKPSLHLLFAEDDRELRASVTRGLNEAGHTVDQAATGLEAERLARAGRYDAIILDILLPGLDGQAVCGAIRQRGDRVPILMLTALDGVQQRIAGLDAGADDYLTKPFDFGELLARLRALTRRSHDQLASEITVGDLVVDTLRRTARRGSRDIPLTGTEFSFLLHLARNTGRVVTRAALMTHVWDDSRTNYTNIIDVYASRLRRKLDEGEAVPLFSTVRGSGFLLEAAPRAPRKATARRE